MSSRSSSSIKDLYGLAASRAMLQAARTLEEILGHAVPRRRLINYLRGNQNPPAIPGGGSFTGSHEVHGLFWSHGASWVGELLDRLAEEGYLEQESHPIDGYRVTGAGKRLLRGQDKPGAEILPHACSLGLHPEVERILRHLRAKLAAREDRPVYGIFTNFTLAHLASLRPSDLGELAAVPGMGEQRLKKYGRKILAALKEAEQV